MSTEQQTGQTGRKEHVRAPQHFTTRLTSDGREGRPVEAGRYRLVVSRACPWAHRVVLVRELFGLQDAITLAVTDPVQEMIDGEYHWVFSERNGDPDGRDAVLGIHALREAYLAAEPDYTGGVSVPGLVDTRTGHLVSNDFENLTLDLATEWKDLQTATEVPDLYPEHLRAEIDALNAVVYDEVNVQVYRAGFAPTQEVYDRAVVSLFHRLDRLEERLREQRFLLGAEYTEADLRLWTTLVRFDMVYHGHFKCNVRKLTEYPALWGYTRDLYQTPGFAETVDFDHIKRHYYATHEHLNPTRIVAIGPDPEIFLTPHGRG
ncbi:glutathione S-transferase family protein [Kitasatospora sp. NPDC096147]|uniref:glutathione S-transferase family protein n=1 Tax=Kitasatospora sp. NPDC096147 TaxID=3364093 RepID=UPI00382E8F68